MMVFNNKQLFQSLLGIMNYLNNIHHQLQRCASLLEKVCQWRMSSHGMTHTKTHMKGQKSITINNASITFYNKIRTIVSKARCIGCQSQRKASAGEGWNAITKELTTKQHGTTAKAFETMSLTRAEMQYSNIKRSPRHTSWSREVPSLLLHLQG